MNEVTFRVRFYRGKAVACLSISDDETLGDLHDLIQEALDWDNDHLWEFITEGTPRDQNRRVYSCEADKSYSHEPAFLGFAERTKISQLNLAPKQRFFYHFDYGDDHYFEIEVAEIRPASKKTEPTVLKRNGKMPEQY